jgi:hypothetical protein
MNNATGMFGTAEDVCKLAREYMKTTGSILHSDTIKLSTTEHFRAKDGTRYSQIQTPL